MNNICDVQCHYMPPRVAENTTFYRANWSDIERQLSVMDECGIEKALLLYPTSDAHLKMNGWLNVCRAYNPEIASIVKKHPDRLIGAGIIPADNPDQIPDELKRIQDLNLKVLSLASSYDSRYLDDEMFHGVWEFARKNRMPVFVHPQIMHPIGEERVSDPLLTPVLEYVFDVSVCIGKMMMNETFLNFPEIKFIFAHYGGVLPFVKERFDNTYQMLRKRNFVKDLTKNPGEYFRNLYFDTSGSRSIASLMGALEITDSAHILFGSDFPANQNMGQSIAVIQNSSLADEIKHNILSANFKRILEV